MAEYKIIYNSIVRMGNFPLTTTEIFATKSQAEAYIASAQAYAGQVISVLEDGQYKQYIVQPNGAGFKLEPAAGDVNQDDLKHFVQVVDSLPNHNDADENIIYILKTTGLAYYKVASGFMQINEDALNKLAPISNPVFTGTVTLANDPTQDMQAATKQYVDRLIHGLVSIGPGVVDANNPLPATGYRAGETWRVAAPGVYAGEFCEPGDLIICIKDYSASTANENDDFLILQANLTGAVTGPNVSTVGNIAIYDNTTGTKIADSNVTIASLNDAIAKAHTHTNKATLDTYDKTQTELLESVETDLVNKIGEIPEGTSVKQYVDTAIGSGGTDAAEAIAQAKAEAIAIAKENTESALTLISF